MPLLRVARAEPAAEAIRLFELVSPDGAPLRPFTAGAHVQVRTPAGHARKYSLCNDPAETHRYVFAVQREAHGHGGSADLFDHVHAGSLLEASEPHNAFELAEDAPGFLFIAGGIGVTPIMSMLRRCVAIAKPFRLVYCSRSPAQAAFRAELAQAPFAPHVTLHHDGGDPALAFDFWPLLEKPGRDHVYCCGPRPMLEAVRDMTGHWPHAAIHFESFVDAAAGAVPADRSFTVVLARSGDRIEVPAGVSILEAMRSRGHDAPSSCESGTCGTCRTRLISGVADHRDFVLMDDEKDTNVMLCVSRALTPELVIDL